MSTTPQNIADPLDDCADGLEGLSPEEQAAILDLAECLKWADQVPFVRALIEHWQEHGPDLTEDRVWADLHGWKGWVVGEQLAQAARLPNNLDDESLHCCQPEQMEFLLRAASGSHWGDETVEEPCTERTTGKAGPRMMYLLLSVRFHQLLQTLPFAQALYQMRIIGINCIHQYGFTKVEQRVRLIQLLDQIAWFRDTDGFHRPDGSIDGEAATMRAYLRGDIE